jgi:hypothetical protein
VVNASPAKLFSPILLDQMGAEIDLSDQSKAFEELQATG